MNREEAEKLMQNYRNAQEVTVNAYKVLGVTQQGTAAYAQSVERYEDALDKEVAAHTQIINALMAGGAK